MRDLALALISTLILLVVVAVITFTVLYLFSQFGTPFFICFVAFAVVATVLVQYVNIRANRR